MVLAFRWEHEIALIDEILLNLTELMYCSKWKEDIAHCVFILSHLPFEESGKDILFWIYDQKRNYTCSKNVFNKLEPQMMFISCKNYFEMFQKYTSWNKHIINVQNCCQVL